MNIIEITQKDVLTLCGVLADEITKCCPFYQGIYPVLRGGAVPASILSQLTGIPIVDYLNEHVLVVDDVVDSGATRLKYKKYDFASLHVKSTTPKEALPTFSAQQLDGWLAYWWEGGENGVEVQEHVTRLLEYIGEDLKREGLQETPARVVKSYKELFRGYSENPKEIVKTFESDGYDQIVLLRDIELYSMCEHHMLPFVGRAHVAYIPGGRVIGISKLARLVDCFARRLQIQERIGEQVTEILMTELKAQGAACIIEADHFCIRMRGVGKQHSTMVTSSMKGVFLNTPAARAELMGLIR